MLMFRRKAAPILVDVREPIREAIGEEFARRDAPKPDRGDSLQAMRQVPPQHLYHEEILRRLHLAEERDVQVRGQREHALQLLAETESLLVTTGEHLRDARSRMRAVSEGRA